MKVKRDTTIWNLLSLLWIPTLAVTAGAFVNANMPYLLEDENYFGIPFSEVGTKSGQILAAGSVISVILTPFFGYGYDIVGRFWMIVPTFFLIAIQLALVPYSAPHISLLILCRAVLSLLMRVLLVKPLLIDYVKSESRGFGMTLQAYGFVLGELIMITLYSLTRSLEMKQQYLVPAVFVGAASVTLIFMVREPTIKEHRRLEDGTREDQVVDPNEGKWERFTRLSREVLTEIEEKPKYVLCFICLMVSRLMNILFAVFIQLWVMSFHKQGVLDSREEADRTYRNIVIGMQIATLATMPAFGYFSDRVDLRYYIPLAFLARGFVCLGFKSIEDPSTWQAYGLAISLTVTSSVQFLAVEVLFMRRMKSTIRGTLNGIAFFFGGVGTTIFVLIGGVLFDKVANWAPFFVVGCSDFAAIIFCLIFFLTGLVKRDD